MLSAHAKVEECIKKYTELYPGEWESFKTWSNEQRKSQKDKFGRVERGSSDLIERKLGEIPEALYMLLKQALSDEEWQWFTAEGPYKGDFRGPYWFYQTYPVFAVSTI